MTRAKRVGVLSERERVAFTRIGAHDDFVAYIERAVLLAAARAIKRAVSSGHSDRAVYAANWLRSVANGIPR